MRLYISADIEGVAGVVNRPQLGPTGFEYNWARENMTDEVNAAIRGARTAGVKEVVVSDSHGNGQNIILDRLEKNVTLVRSWPREMAMMEGINHGCYAGVFLLGYHAGTNNMRGTLAHTLNSSVLTDITLNGIPASESLISASLAGHFSTSVLMVSGDDVYVEDAKEQFKGISSVITKWSSGTLSARCRRPSEVQEEIEQVAKQAIISKDKVSPYVIDLPITVRLGLKSRFSVDLLEYLPFITRTGAYSIEFEAPDMPTLSKLMTFILQYQPDL